MVSGAGEGEGQLPQNLSIACSHVWLRLRLCVSRVSVGFKQSIHIPARVLTIRSTVKLFNLSHKVHSFTESENKVSQIPKHFHTKITNEI